MSFIWELNPKFQVFSYLRMCQSVQSGFYQDIRAIILARKDPKGWYLPDLGLFSDPTFVEQLSTLDAAEPNLEIPTDLYIYKAAKERFTEYMSENDIVDLKEKFNSIIPMLDAMAKTIFPSYSQIEDVYIIPRSFGSDSSFFSQKSSNGKDVLFLCTRVDSGVEPIVKAYIARLISNEYNDERNGLLLWGQRQAVIDFFCTKTNFKNLAENQLNGVLKFLTDNKGNLIQESANYFAHLGYPVEECFTIKRDAILFNNKPVVGLSHSQFDLLHLLVERHSEIVSFDASASAVWGADASKRFSLEALAKVIQKLRISLQKQGIPDRYIHTVRKKGYILYD